MGIRSSIRPFWDEFQASIDFDASLRFYEVFHFDFDDNEATADFLAELVLNGTKRATPGLLWVFKAEHKPVPKPGDLNVVTNWASEPLCIWRPDCAQSQQASLWEARALASLCCLHQAQGWDEGCRRPLAELYAQFTEGFETEDLQVVRAVMRELA